MLTKILYFFNLIFFALILFFVANLSSIVAFAITPLSLFLISFILLGVFSGGIISSRKIRYIQSGDKSFSFLKKMMLTIPLINLALLVILTILFIIL